MNQVTWQFFLFLWFFFFWEKSLTLGDPKIKENKRKEKNETPTKDFLGDKKMTQNNHIFIH